MSLYESIGGLMVASGKDKFEFKLSRRTFLSAIAALPLISLNSRPAEAASITPFSFVYLCDTHLASGIPDNGFKMVQESQLFLQEVIKGINALKPDFVIFGGDQVETVGANDANWQFFIDLVQQLNCPWYFVLGEQDVSGKTPVDKMKEFGPDFKGRGSTDNNSYWSADPVSNVHLIGLDSSKANTSTGEISDEQIDWLKKDLQSNRGKFTIVISHHPVLPPAPYDGGPPFDDYILPNGSDVREVLGTSSDVRLVLSGHLYMNKVQIERDIYHISSAGLDIYPCQYKYFRVTKDSIVMESFEAPFPALVKKAKKALLESSFASKINRKDPNSILELCEGAAEDQNALLSLGANKSVRALSKKQLKEDQSRRDDEIEKQKEELRNKGKSKGKKTEPRKEDSKGSKPDSKNQEADQNTNSIKEEESKVETKTSKSNTVTKKSSKQESSKRENSQKSNSAKSKKEESSKTKSENTKADSATDKADNASEPAESSPPASPNP
ncbi:MAG: metallophosphoesterase [Candidatus Obscuribacterales bacterium]|nr:metallophosphoesterase [Candidatus Obscuribacterales bacterium]